jgi:hypothetical protein
VSSVSTVPALELKRFRGDSATLSIPLYNPDTGAAYTPTGPLKFDLKASDANLDAAALIEKLSNVGGITLANPSVVTLVADDADLLDARVTYLWGVIDTATNRQVARGTFWTEQRIPRDGALAIETHVIEPDSPYLSAQEIEANRAAAEAAADSADENALATLSDRIATADDREHTAADRVATGQDREATSADRTQTGLDRIATGEDRTQTGLDRTQTGLDRIATGEDRTQTGLDRTQTGLDRTAAAASAASVNAADLAARDNARATRGGIVSAGTSAVGTTQDNTGLAFGTSDLTIGMWVRLADWTPGTAVVLVTKQVGNLGIYVQVKTTGELRLALGTGATVNSYDTGINAITDGALAFIAITMDRDGNALFYVNGALFATKDISALAAQTLTCTAALTWLDKAGTLGECWIINGLLSASRIADIYRAGSIAPFCVMTANATTGQNTATIDGLSFFQWLECDQGYGPIIRDRSGNNQHAIMGTTGLFHVVRKNPPGQPERAPRGAVISDGSAGAKASATLNSQNPNTGAAGLWIDGVFAASPDANARMLGVLTPDDATWNTGRSYSVWVNNSLVTVRLCGATSTDTRSLASSGVFTLLVDLWSRGVRTVIVAVRNKVYLGISGDFFDVTNLFTEATAGTPPAWTDQINGVYLKSFFATASLSVAGQLFDLRLANVSMSEAQLRTEYQRGEPGPEWVGASKAVLNTSACADIDYGAGFSGASATGFTAVAASGNHFARAAPSFPVVIGQRIRVTGTLTLNNGKTVLPSARLTSSLAVGIPAAGAFSIDIVSSIASATSSVNFDTNGDADYTISNLACTKLGWTTRLRTDTAAGLTALNGAKSATNDATDFLLSTTGIAFSPSNPRRAIIRADAPMVFTSPGTLNLQLRGAACVDNSKRWRIVSISGTADGPANISFGTASGGEQYVSAQAVISGYFDIATFASRRTAGANIWVKSSATVTLTDVVVILDLVE